MEISMYDEFETLVANSPDENGTESDVVSTMEETQEDGEPETSSEDESSEIETEVATVEEFETEVEYVAPTVEDVIEPEQEESFDMYFGHRVYYNSSGYPYYLDESGERQYIFDVENIVGSGENVLDETVEDEFDDIDVSDSEAIVLAINQQTETIQNGNISICVALGLLLGVVFIQGIRLRRV